MTKAKCRRQWASQLRREHANICFQYRIALRSPAFEIADSRKTLGVWVSKTRTIRIAAGLIEDYAWDIVVNVLKHEMAHQYVDEYLGRGSEKAHGPFFKTACEKLGVPPEFRSAGGDIRAMIGNFTRPETGNRATGMRARVEKLLSLAQSTNEHEALAAMRKANTLIRKHNLDLRDSGQQSRYGYHIINHRVKRLDLVKKTIAAILLDHFFVDVVYAGLYDAEDHETYKTIELLGTRENLVLARYVYDFLLRKTEHLWQRHQKSAGLSQRQRRSYVLGVLKGFRERLARDEKEMRRENNLPAGALALAADTGLTEFIDLRFPRLRKTRGKGTSIYATAYAAGKKEGGKLVIHKGIEISEGYLGRLLK